MPVRPRLEALEERLAPATIVWNVNSNGSWNTASNWSPQTVPGPNDTAIINPSVPVTVTLSGTDSVQNIQTGSGQRLLLTGGANLTVSGTITNNGMIEAEPSSAGYVFLQFSGNVTLGGTGQLLMDSEVDDYYVVAYATSGSTVTNEARHTIHSVGVGVGYFGAYDEGTVVNQGVMEADGTGNYLGFDGSLLTNEGTLQGINGGSLELSSGGSSDNDKIDNSSGTIALDGGKLTDTDIPIQGVPGQIVVAFVAELRLYGFWVGERVIPEFLCLLEKPRVTGRTGWPCVQRYTRIAFPEACGLDGCGRAEVVFTQFPEMGDPAWHAGSG